MPEPVRDERLAAAMMDKEMLNLSFGKWSLGLL